MKKYSKNSFPQRLKHCRNVHKISHYKNCVFYCRCSYTFVAMATKSFHRLIMGKLKVGFYFSHCRYFDKSFTEMFSTKYMNLISCHGNRKAKFMNKFSKIIFSEAIRGMKLKLCRNVHNISLYKAFLVDVGLILSLLWQLNVSIDL